MIGNRRLPDRIFMEVPLTAVEAHIVATRAAEEARRLAPKLSGVSSAGMEPLWGDGFIGVRWAHSRVLFQDQGTRPFTMNKLAGKTIPMWVDDPTGTERARNPKAKTRVTASGRTQVLIFRRAAHHGERKVVRRDGVDVSVPRSYPGAPGRIAVREAKRPWTTPGKIGGAVAHGNVGVRWRHPGLVRRGFLEQGLLLACAAHSIQPGATHLTDDEGFRVAA